MHSSAFGWHRLNRFNLERPEFQEKTEALLTDIVRSLLTNAPLDNTEIRLTYSGSNKDWQYHSMQWRD